MTIIIYSILTFIFSFIIRIIFVISPSTDDSSHLWMIKERRRNRDLRQHDIPCTPLKGYRGYPPLSHYIIGLFPEKHWMLAGKLLNILYDCFSVLIVLYSSYYIFKNMLPIRTDPALGAFITALLYGSSPIFFPVNARLVSIGARTLGVLLYLIFINCYAIANIMNIHWLFIFCILIIFLTVMSSQFAMQNLIWICIFLSLINLTIIPIIILITGILISLLPAFDGKKLFYRKYSHFSHWYIPYLKKGTKDNLGVISRNKLKDLIQLPYNIFKNRQKAYLTFFFQNSYLIAAYSMPVFYFLAYYLILQYNSLPLNQHWVTTFCLHIITASILIFLFTSLRPFLFLGEGERYLEFAVFPINLLAVYFILKFSVITYHIFFIILTINIVIICLNFVAFNIYPFLNVFTNKVHKDFHELVNFLKTLKKPSIITLPTKFAFKLSSFLGDNASYYYDNICHPESGISYMINEQVRLHYFSPDFSFFYKKYGINTFVFSTEELKKSEEYGIHYNIKGIKKIFANDTFIVCKYINSKK